jgi:hypothetical protein
MQNYGVREKVRFDSRGTECLGRHVLAADSVRAAS